MDSQSAEVKGQIRPIRPSIIIGVGGTGQRIVMNIRKKIVEAYDSLDRLPIVGFMVLDTDPERPIMPDLDDAFLQKVNLNPSEFIHATVTGTHKLKDELRSYPHLSEWLDRRILDLGDVTVGAKGIRAIGRLSFFLNYDRIKLAFTTLQNKVLDKSNLDYMAINHGIQVDPGINVYIIASVCGGTGSGMFLDLAFMVKHLLQGSQENRIGYLILPGVFGTDMTYAAGYAALRELNHYSLNNDFTANWEKEQKARRIQPPPFHFCYLVNNRNAKVTFSKPNDLFEMVAHNIFLDFAHEFGQYKASLKDNISAVMGGTDKLGCPLNFISMGLASIYFPRERVQNACAYRLARQVVDRWLFTGGFTDRIGEYVSHYLDINRMLVDTDSGRRNLLKDHLLLTEDNKTWYGKVDEELQAAYRGLQNQDLKSFTTFLERREEEFLKKLYDADKDPERWGEFFRGVNRNKDRKLKDVLEKVEKDIAAMLMKENEGLGFARQFVERLNSEMTRYKDYFMKKFDELSKLENSFASAKSNQYRKLRQFADQFILNKKEVMLRHCEEKILEANNGALASFYKRKVDKKILELSIEFCTKLIAIIEKQLIEIDNFKTKMERLNRILGETEKNLISDTSGLIVNGELLYDPGDIDVYFSRFVSLEEGEKKEKDILALLTSTVLGDMKAPTLFDLRRDDYREREVLDRLVTNAKPYFDGVREISVARKFFEKYPADQQALMALRNIFSSSEVFLNFKTIPDFRRLPNSKVSLIGVFGGRQATLPEFKDLIPQLEKCCSEPGQLRGIQPIRGKNEVLFTTEEGAFPLRMLNDIDAYEAKYDQFLEGMQNPLHLRKDEQDYLLEINMPSQEEQRKTKIAVLVGIASGVIVPDEDNPRYLIYRYSDPKTGLKESKPVGKMHEEERVIDSLLSRSNKSLRDILFNECAGRLAAAARNLAEKEKMWRSLDAYDQDLTKRKSQEILEERGYHELISSVIEEHSLYDPSFAAA